MGRAPLEHPLLGQDRRTGDGLEAPVVGSEREGENRHHDLIHLSSITFSCKKKKMQDASRGIRCTAKCVVTLTVRTSHTYQLQQLEVYALRRMQVPYHILVT